MIFPVSGLTGRALLVVAVLIGLISTATAAPQAEPSPASPQTASSASAPQAALSASAPQTSSSSSNTAVVAAPGEVPFRAGVSEVIVPVTVTDFQDRFVDDLNKVDFKLYDENIPQTITFFSRDRKQPVVVGFLVDMSNRNVIHWKTLREAVVELVLNLLPPDKPQYAGYLVPYSTTAELAVDTTSEAGALVERLEQLKPGGGSALYDAIYMACTRRSLMKGEPIEPRRVLIIVGDGVDTASTHGLEEVLELAQRNLVTIYGLSTQAYGFASTGDSNLVRLATETGGRVEYPLEGVYKNVTGYLSKPQDAGNFAMVVGTGGYATQIAQSLFEAVTGIVGEINTQYILRYVPTNTDSPRVFRRVRVEVNLPNVKIRARSGYYPYNP
ncbi:MAG: VWA domain-containing protein [Bryobacterales bacterium]|nr:VWA domain-containing protein [Bryobacterales bacterium]